MAEKTFVDGFIAKLPHAKAPDFVVAHLSIKAKELIAFIEKYQKPDGWLNLDLLKSKDGQKIYAVLNDWKPEQKNSSPSVVPEYPVEEIDESGIPF